MEVVKGHISPETAVVVDDYPYGCRLRCKIRYWLEYRKGKGFRFVSQTTNPKLSSETWNRPKVSTYCNGPAVLVRLPNGHIECRDEPFARLEVDRAQSLLEDWREALPEAFVPELERFIRVKRRYRQLMETGVQFQAAARQAIVEEAKGGEYVTTQL